MRTIEKKITEAIFNSKECKLSSHDRTSKGKVGIIYFLHDTPLFIKSFITGKKAIYLSSKGAYESPISATTKSRLNAFLELYDMPKIRQKNFELFFEGEKLKTNCWYRLDCVNQKLVEMESFNLLEVYYE